MSEQRHDPMNTWEEEGGSAEVEDDVYNREETRSTEWHMLDAERGYQVRETEDGYQVMDENGEITDLSAGEFEQFRTEGPNPKGLS